MIVDCHSCGATYNISDEKVRGRRVRVRCKSCNEGIIVDGTRLDAEDATRVYSPNFEPAAYAAAEASNDESTRVMSAGGPEWRAPDTEDWTVNVSETEQRVMGLPELVSAYTGGLVSDDAFVWREGMDDWLPIRDVPELRAAIESNEATRVVSPAAAVRAPLGPRAAIERAAARRPAAPARAPAQRPSPPAAEAPGGRPAAPARTGAIPPARVREGRAHGADLFGGVEAAGGEAALLSSSSLPLAQYDDDKPIGARNESSVLFSLNTLKASAHRGGASSAPPRPLSASPQTAADILGMTTGGAMPGIGVTALLSAPPVDAPIPAVAHSPPRSRMDTTPPSSRGKAPLLLVAAVVVCAALVAGGAFFLLRSRLPQAAHSAEPASPPKVAAEPPKTPPSTTALATSNEVASARPPTPAAPAAEHAGAPPLMQPAAPKAATPSAPSPNLEAMKAALRPDEPKASTKPGGDKGAAKGQPEKVVLADEPSGGADPGGEAPAEEPPKPPFDTIAAKAALEAASSSAASCKQQDGPTGRGKVQVTFSPAGRTTSANVIEGPFGGTPVGGCVAKVFRGARVPAFSGDAVTVSKSFTIPE